MSIHITVKGRPALLIYMLSEKAAVIRYIDEHITRVVPAHRVVRSEVQA